MDIFYDNGQPRCLGTGLVGAGFRANMIRRIPPPTQLGRSAESPVPRPSTSIIAQKLGDEWYVLARHPSGQQEHVRRFKSETEAKNWIARKSKAWLKKQGYADDDSTLPGRTSM
jgi:hypothetical protein